MQFSATVANAVNSAVTWSVDGIAGGNGANGTISSAGMYAAPQVLPPSSETIAATSVSDPTKSATASILVTSDVRVSVSPVSAAVQPGGTQQFSATISSAGRPSAAVTWLVNGIAGGNASLGTISAGGFYTAPQTVISALNITVTAQSVADPGKSAAALVNVAPPPVSVTVMPASATVGLGSTQIFSAQVTGALNTNVTWDVNGITGGNSSVGTLTPAGTANSVIYSAPISLVAGAITIRATSAANPAASGSAAITLASTANVSISPASAILAVNHRQTLIANVNGTANSNVTWLVNGIAGGNPAIGQICATGSNPCQVLSNPVSGGVDYVAPGAVPSPNPLQLTAVGQADPSKSAAAAITILPHIVVAVSPPSATVAAGSLMSFSASVLGSSDQDVIWNVSGAACGAAGVCGVINANGQFTAPVSAPSPDAITITATSEDDTSRTGTSNITISTSPVITQLLPASAVAGAAGGFSLRVLGGNFVTAASGSASTIVIGGAARTTICASAGDCSASLAAADLTGPGNLEVQIQNPDGSVSPAVPFVVVSEASPPNPVSLTASNPSAAGVDISVVDPSTAGSTLPQPDVSLAIQAMGIFSTSTNSCSLGGAAIVLQRPASGTAVMDVCAFSVSGLDPSFNYWISGPAPPDVTIAAVQGLGLGIVDLTLMLPATAKPGARTLFVQNLNKDVAAASGALEVRE